MGSFVGVLLGAALSNLAFAGDDPKSLKEQLATIAAEAEVQGKKVKEELKAAGEDQDKIAKVVADFNQGWQRRLDAAQRLLKQKQHDPSTFDGIILLVQTLGGSLDDELAEVAWNHREDRKAGDFFFALRGPGGRPWAERLLTRAANAHPDRIVRGRATYALGEYYRISAFPLGLPPSDDEVARLLGRASEFYALAIKEYADVSLPDQKANIGVRANLELIKIKNLPDLKVGRPAPAISGEGIDGRPLKLNDHRGKVIVLVFWGSWCAPCMEMVPHERELKERLRDRPFALLGVNCGDKREIAKQTMADRSMGWPSWWDGEEMMGPIESAYNIQHYPTIYVIDRTGIIRFIDVRGKDLDQAVESLLQE